MISASVGDGAIGFFSQNARAFHDNYSRSDGFKERVEVWDDILRRHVTRGGMALDAGCGSGIFSFRMAELGSRVIGLDGAPDMIDLCEAERAARKMEGVTFLRATFPHVDEASLGRADLVISSSVLEFVSDLDAMLALFSRVTKPGAALVVSLPNALSLSRCHQRLKFLFTGQPEVYRHIKHFSHPRAFAARAQPYGFALEETHHYAHLTKLAGWTRQLRLPRQLSADLFVCVFRKADA